ncbi:MAG: DUF1800 domain-containing protein [Rhodocyclaceae bacterium]
MRLSIKNGVMSACLLVLFTACGGGGGKGGVATGIPGGSSSSSAGGSASSQEPVPAATPVSRVAAARFLVQASFGPTEAGIDDVSATGPESWIARQFNTAQSSHLAYVDNIKANVLTTGQNLSQNHFFESFWKQTATGDDQLRQRVAFALSEIMVVSFDGTLSSNIRTVASYYDMLGRDAFGNFRTLLHDVTLHPAMGQYLTYLRNQKEDPAKGRVPDENYAREVMQLFTVGLYQLNADGTVVTQGGKPVETYTNADVSGLARVLTGWSWAGPDTSDARWNGYSSAQDPNRDTTPMQLYAKYHSTSEKRFLGATIAAGSGDGTADLNIALDTLFNHPNVGPFIGRQLIQRLVTSNPSPAYVSRVAAAFANNGKGERGDMKAVIRAVLLDPEARDVAAAQAEGYGKLREPIVRMANWMRAFKATPASGRFQVGNTDNAGTSLGQSPMRSSSVFNFFRPGYTPPGTRVGAASLVAPEMQITNETSVAGYMNTMQNAIQGYLGPSTDRMVPDYTTELALAEQPAQLVDRLNLILVAGALRPATINQIVSAVQAITLRTNTAANNATDRKNRVQLAVLLTLASPEFIVQK